MTRLKRTFRRQGFLSNREKSTIFLALLFGLMSGFLFSSIARRYFLLAPKVKCQRSKIVVSTAIRPSFEPKTRFRNLSTEVTGSKGFILIGVMTAYHLLETRAKTIHKTWGKNSTNVKILFFCGETRNTTVDHVVYLAGVDDGYPPQRKSFQMLKYIHDHFIDDFHWFIRADDDVYMRLDYLVTLLRMLDSSEDVLIGQPGVGKMNEKGKLGLPEGDNFCLGGPGVVMSQTVLRKVAPYLMTCLNETASSHEDVEVSRCVRRYVGVMCPWAQEAHHLFYQIFASADFFFSGHLDKKTISRAITVHPVKEPSDMFRLHSHFLTTTVQLLQDRGTKLHQRRQRATMLLTRSNITEGFVKANFYGRLPRNSSAHWEFFDLQYVYGLSEPPVFRISGCVLQAARNFIGGVVKEINMEAKKELRRPEDYKKMSLGFMRVYPPLGVQYTIDLETLLKPSFPNVAEMPKYGRHYMHFQQSFAPLVKSTVVSDSSSSLVVHFIVPLLKRFKAFLRFLNSFEEAFIIQGKPVALLIVYFPNVSSPEQHKKVFENFRANHPKVDLRWSELAGEFSRARALEFGTKRYDDDALLFFADVDLVFSTEFYHRCQTNTNLGHRVYFPTMYSQFNPQIVYHNRTMPPENSRVLTKRAGIWRKYSFGPACIYASDVSAVGGLNTSIRGWGLEDVDFYEKCLKYELDVFRAPDYGLLHGYHPQTNCLDPRMNVVQAKMCEDSRLKGLASAESLVDYILSKGYA